MNIKIARLNHILAVARERNFARAAEAEGLTQPALSHSIASFENDYGLRLFDRGRGGIAVTPAGSLVLEHARQIVSATEELDRRLRQFGKGESGTIAFGLGPHLASMLLPEVSSTLLHTRPRVQIRPTIGPTEQLLEKLKDGGIEFIIGHSRDIALPSKFVLEPLSSLTLAVLARSGHPLADRGGLKLADLSDYPVASANELPAGGDMGAAGCLVCDNFHILRDVVETTDCVWVSSPPFVSRQLEQGRLVRLDVEDFAHGSIEIGIISRNDRTKSPAALALMDELGKVLARFERDAD